MAYADGLVALLGVCALSLFLARKTGLNAALFPLPVLSVSTVWLLFFGMAGRLLLGGALWYILAAAALLALLLQGGGKKLRANAFDALQRALVPGFVFFAAAGIVLWVWFAVTQPMFIRWDEFSFWGVACRMTKRWNMLHTVAPGNLSARSYLPGMMLVSYLFQFFGAEFAEWKVFAAYDILAFAAFSAFAAFEKPRWPLALLTLAGVVLLPYLFCAPGDDAIATVYRNAMGDMSLGLVMGGALCIYWHACRKKGGMVLAWSCLLLLTLIKDMGMVYAAVAAALMALDTFIWPRLSLKSLGKALGFGAACALPVVGLYFGWGRYVLAAGGIDRNVVGGLESWSYGAMLADGIRQFMGTGRADMAEKFNMVKGLIASSVVHTPISLGGSCLAVCAVLAGIALLCLACAPKGQRRRPAVFIAASLAAFAAFVLFHLLLYVYSFSGVEAQVLKDFDRYMAPFLMGLLISGLCMLQTVGTAVPLAAEGLGVLVTCGFVALFCLRGAPTAGFWQYPETNYALRQEIAYRASLVNPDLQPDDEVMLISQGDDATRWYYYCYELDCTLANGMGGYSYVEYNGNTDRNWETTSVSLVSPYTDSWQSNLYAYQTEYKYTVQCTRDDLVAFLREKQYDYLLLDQSDTYIMYEFADLFTEKPPYGRTDAAYLYRICDDGTTMTFEPYGEVRYEK